MEHIWIYDILPKVFDMSITASVVIGVVFLIRILLRKAPKIFSYLLWSVVLFRLLCPVTISSPVVGVQVWNPVGTESDSVQAYSEKVQGNKKTSDIISQKLDGKAEGKKEDTLVSNQVEQKNTITADASISKEELAVRIGSLIWLIGMIGMIAQNILSSLKLRRKLVGSVCLKDNIYICDYIDTPFAKGIVSPKIYLPSFLSEAEKQFIILHEQTHIHRGDHIAKLLAYVALTIHWFNPLVWAAFYFAGKDMEMACDETVMRNMERDIRVEYSNSLLCLATGKNIIGGSPLAFGSGDTKGRIKNVMQYKKPSVIVISIAIVVVLGSLLFLGINQTTEKKPDASTAGDAENLTQSEDAVEEFVTTWAKAFCERDGEKIVQLSSGEVCNNLKETEFFNEEKEYYVFGDSIPWPQNVESDYQIISMTDTEAVILYYAWTSEPHVCVWEETITYEKTDAAYQVVGEQRNIYDNISTGSEFAHAYPTGIANTPMDYVTNGKAELLNFHAVVASNWTYQTLSNPETAALYLLNINEENVTVTSRDTGEDGAVFVDIDFDDGDCVAIKMMQPLGEDGMAIWIPQDYGEVVDENANPNDLLYSENEFLGQYGENGSMFTDEYYEEYGERIIYSTTADITHDGIEDKLDLIITTKDTNTSAVDLLKGMSNAYIKAYKGTGENKYEDTAFYVSKEISDAHAGNGQIGLVRKDGMDYLLLSSMYEIQGTAEYKYVIFYIDTEQKQAVCVDEDLTVFDCEEDMPILNIKKADVLPAFRQSFEKWLADATLFVSCDVNGGATPEICISEPGEEYVASDYYDTVWE